MKYIRYRFKTESVDDPRPLIDMSKINMPWWCTGYAADNASGVATSRMHGCLSRRHGRRMVQFIAGCIVGVILYRLLF